MIRTILSRKKIEPNAVYTGFKKDEIVSCELFKYNSKHYIEEIDYSLTNFEKFSSDNYQYWLNVVGIHDTDLVKKLCFKMGIEHLTVQDILDINQRPKFQSFENYKFVSIKSLLPKENNEIKVEQISFIIGENYLVSFQEEKVDYFDHVRQRIRKKVGIVRENKTWFLFYLLMESILDNYFITLDNIEKEIDNLNFLETDLHLSTDILKKIEFFKRQNHLIRKTINSIKEFISKMERENFEGIEKHQIKYFYELADMCASLVDSCEQTDVRLESYTNLFFSIQGDSMNKVMKTLTVVSTIFIPLSFIGGVYGMNFINMPELHWKYGYLSVWLLMIVIFISMIFYFRRKKWF